MQEERERLISEQKRSGLTIAEFSRERGIPAHRLYGRRKREGKEDRSGRFVRVGKGTEVTVIVSESLKVEVPVERLREVLEILGVHR